MERRTGFTLIELLVALAILALITGIVFPDMRRGLAAQSLRGGTIAALTALRSGRARAIATDAPVRVSIGADGATLIVQGERPSLLPAPARARIAPADGILFYADGSSDGGELKIAGADRSFRFVVAPTTGLVRSE